MQKIHKHCVVKSVTDCMKSIFYKMCVLSTLFVLFLVKKHIFSFDKQRLVRNLQYFLL